MFGERFEASISRQLAVSNNRPIKQEEEHLHNADSEQNFKTERRNQSFIVVIKLET